MTDGRVMIVTGASSGIGRALAERAARGGFRVFAVGRRAERLDELQRIVQGANGALETLVLELRSPGAPERIVRETLARYGRIDVLVNMAGSVAVGAISAQSDEALREQFETHAIVPLALTREALPELRRTHGHIFFVGSGVARVPVGGLGAYPAAKAAVRNLVRIVRNEVRGAGIAVTYVDPGAVATEFMTRAGFAGPPRLFAAQAHDVAARIYDALKKRKPVVNAVPWQTSLVALAEAFPNITDFLLSKMPQIVGTALPPSEPIVAEPILVAPVVAEPVAEPVAVEPVALPQSIQNEPEPGALHDTAGHAAAENVDQAPAGDSGEADEAPSPFEAALAPHANRMHKLNLSTTFVAGLLSAPGASLDVDDVSMRWAGMPNKNERNVTRTVLEALADAGFLARTEPDSYTVVRSAPGGRDG